MTERGLPPGLARKRQLARAALWFEQIWPAIWPALGVLGAFITLALLGLPAWLPPWPRALLPALLLIAIVGLLWRGWRTIKQPGPDVIDRRLERTSGLAHRPLAALQDKPATPTPEAARIWAIHQTRLRAQLGRLRVGIPRPGLARRDRWALRGLILLALVASWVIAGDEAPGRLRSALWPTVPAAAAAPGTMVQAWVTPPAYTGLAPVFLHAGQQPAPIPAGAHLTVSVTGGSTDPALHLAGDITPFLALDAAPDHPANSWQAERDLKNPGRLSIMRGTQELAGWNLDVLADHPPEIRFTEPPAIAGSNTRVTLRSRFAWSADDDYGLASVSVELRLRERPDAPPLVLQAPLAGSPKHAHAAIVQDLTAHPWAGLGVTARMVAKDAPGQRGESAEALFELPERPFRNPVAQALIMVRKQLSRTPDERQQSRQALDAIASRPDLFDNDAGVVLNLHGVSSLLNRGRGQTAVDEAQARLWAMALALEEANTDRTARALEQARQAMRDAMDAARRDPQDQAAKTELEKRMEELRAAIQKHIEALMEQARREGAETPLDPSVPQMNARDLDRMAEQMEKAAREGRMDDAQKQMAELEKLLEQLQNARPEHGEQREQRNAERRQQGRQQQDAVQDLVQREGGLLDRSRNRAEGAPAPDTTAKDPPKPGQDQRSRDQRAQNAMRRALGELMQRFGDLTGQVPAPLSEADTAMREAGQAMAEGRDAAAGAAQQKAIEALQKGGRAMGQQLARQFGRGEQQGEGENEGDQDGQDLGDSDQGQGQGDNATTNRDGQTNGPRPGDPRRRSTRRDPLGRPMPDANDGREEGTDGQAVGAGPVPTEMEQARTRALQEELRRRGADRTRPPGELDYIDRLLKSF